MSFHSKGPDMYALFLTDNDTQEGSIIAQFKCVDMAIRTTMEYVDEVNPDFSVKVLSFNKLTGSFDTIYDPNKEVSRGTQEYVC